MAERFLATLPFISSLSAKVGAILGDRENCKYLLARDESILVFPEGVKGISKPTSLFYKLQPFTAGFYRIAVENKVNILPISVIGAEEMYPKVYHSLFLARLSKSPCSSADTAFSTFGYFGIDPDALSH
jgi:1-acyl-sn-glycerol-3-phosphate acyltransferase